jgi:O-antigen/teichoic acid export membrane protein
VRSSAPLERAREWRRSGLTLAAASVLSMAGQRLDLVLVGVLLTAASAGVYGVAVAAASLTAIAYMAVAVPLGPVVARLHAEGEHARLARTVSIATRAIVLATVAIGAALALGGSLGLGLLGDAFEDGSAALALLCLAALVNAAFATNMLVLVMTGHERLVTVATGAGTVLTAALCLALIPVAGLEGAATAVVLSTLARNVLGSWFAWTRLGLDTTVLGRRPRYTSSIVNASSPTSRNFV